tara:strand:+ start:3370 stop:3966 length:597 start_codon:yes stop_codon:yes gene_type:complete
MLTRKEQQTFDFITKYHKKFGESPLLRQIAEGIGIKSKGVAHRYVEALVKERKIKKFPYRHRGNIINQKKSLNGLRIKSFGKIVAGSPIDAVSDKDIIELDHIFSNEKCFALKVQGNSMIEAGVNDGDWVIVEKQNKPITSKIMVILIDNQDVTLKYIKQVSSDTVRLIPANKDLSAKTYNISRISIQGVIIGQIRVY